MKTIECWAFHCPPLPPCTREIAHVVSLEAKHVRIIGQLDGQDIITSTVIYVDGRDVVTRSGSRYRLADPDPEFRSDALAKGYADPSSPADLSKILSQL